MKIHVFWSKELVILIKVPIFGIGNWKEESQSKIDALQKTMNMKMKIMVFNVGRQPMKEDVQNIICKQKNIYS